jgi:hypothetical protein
VVLNASAPIVAQVPCSGALRGTAACRFLAGHGIRRSPPGCRGRRFGARDRPLPGALWPGSGAGRRRPGCVSAPTRGAAGVRPDRKGARPPVPAAAGDGFRALPATPVYTME